MESACLFLTPGSGDPTQQCLLLAGLEMQIWTLATPRWSPPMHILTCATGHCGVTQDSESHWQRSAHATWEALPENCPGLALPEVPTGHSGAKPWAPASDTAPHCCPILLNCQLCNSPSRGSPHPGVRTPTSAPACSLRPAGAGPSPGVGDSGT